MDSFPKTLKSPNFVSWLEFRRRISFNKKLDVLWELWVWYKTKLQLFIGNTKFEVSGITDFFARVCKDPLICVGNCTYLLESVSTQLTEREPVGCKLSGRIPKKKTVQSSIIVIGRKPRPRPCHGDSSSSEARRNVSWVWGLTRRVSDDVFDRFFWEFWTLQRME